MLNNYSKKKPTLISKIKLHQTKIWLVIALLGSATFGQFILEEALQNYGFGIGSMIFAKTYQQDPEDALTGLEQYESFHDSCQAIMNVLTIGNPITAIWFQKFMESNRLKIVEWKKIVKNYMEVKLDAKSNNRFGSRGDYSRNVSSSSRENSGRNRQTYSRNRQNSSSGSYSSLGRGRIFENDEIKVYYADWGRVTMYKKPREAN